MFWIKIKNLQTEIVSKILKLIVCCLELLSVVHNDRANFNHKMNIRQSATNDAKIVLPLLINYWCLMVDQVWSLFPAVTFLPFQQLECGLKLNIVQADPKPGEDWTFIHYEHSAGIMPGKTIYGCERVFLIRQFFICGIILFCKSKQIYAFHSKKWITHQKIYESYLLYQRDYLHKKSALVSITILSYYNLHTSSLHCYFPQFKDQVKVCDEMYQIFQQNFRPLDHVEDSSSSRHPVISIEGSLSKGWSI